MEETSSYSFGIFSCDNAYHCLETFIIGGFAVATFYFYLKGYKTIKNDRAQILEKMDKVIYYLAFVYSGFAAFTTVIYAAPFLTFTMRVLYLILDIVICSVIACIYFPQGIHPRIEKLTMVAFGWTVLLWFFSVMGRQTSESSNECQYFGIILFSLTGLVVSGLLGLFGYGSIKIIKATETETNENNIYVTETGEPLSQNRKYEELAERINQLTILIAINVGAALVQLFWDMKKYNNPKYCDRVTFSHNFIDLISFLIIKGFILLIPPWGVYYVYFWRNKDNFRADTGNWDRHLSDFDEIRSELIELS